MLTGRARSFDDVSEFMRGLNNVTRCPRGLARVVERKRNGGFLRVELVEGRREVLEYPRNQVHFFFAGLELKSTEASAQREVGFTLFFPVVTEDRPPR